MPAREATALQRLSARLADRTASLVPDAFSIASILTALTFALAMTWGGASPASAVRAWGGGVWALLPLSMQIAFVIFAGYLLAVSPPARAALERIATLARSPRQAVALAAFSSMTICWLNWGVGLVASAMLIRAIAARRTGADYRLLVAAGYLGMGTTWHAGPSGTVPLLFAGGDSFMIRDGLIAAPVSLSTTLFTVSNLVFVATVIVVLTALASVLQPRDGSETIVIDAPAEPATATSDADHLRGVAASISRSRWPTLFLGSLGVLYVSTESLAGRFTLSLDGVNLIVISLALLAYGSPAALLGAVEGAARPLHGVVLQFPLYAGIYGLIRDAGLAEKLAQVFLTVATTDTLPVIVFAYSAVLNYWVPSGGAKWAMEAPYLLKTGAALGVGPEAVAIAYAYGDMATNLIQPFWAIPLLGVARLEFKDILGYELLFFAVFTAIAVVALF